MKLSLTKLQAWYAEIFYFLCSAPPTYEASVFGARSTVERSDNQYVYGEKDFAPKYPVYYHQPWSN
jgi:hypothetical protein